MQIYSLVFALAVAGVVFTLLLGLRSRGETQTIEEISPVPRTSVEDVLKRPDESLLETLEAETRQKGRPGPEQMEWPKIHIVEQGQTLSEISVQYYGTSGKWKKILEENRLRLKNENEIRPGMRLIIPQ